MTRTALSLIVIVAAGLCLAQPASADSFKGGKHHGNFGNHCWRPPCPPQWKPCPPPICPPHWNPCPPKFGFCPPQWGVYPTPYPQPVSPVFGQHPPYFGGGFNGFQNDGNFRNGASQQNANRPDPSSLFSR